MTKSELKSDKIGDRAIVLGGSIAGMLSTRVQALPLPQMIPG